jgi:predicted Zn finger-like uncharacterized protein
MKFITRCHSCRTLFLVVPDQLRVAAGWVRCGQCRKEFDGLSCLLEGSNNASLARMERVSSPTHLNAHTSCTQISFLGEVLESIDPKVLRINHLPLLSQIALEQALDVREVHAMMKQSMPAAIDSISIISDECINLKSPTTPVPASSFTPQSNDLFFLKNATNLPNIPLSSDSKISSPLPSTTKQKIHWMNNKTQYSWWRRVLVVLIMVILVVGGGLAIYNYPNGIVAEFPSYRQSLELACRTLGCKLSAERDLSMLSIGMSSLSRESHGALQLSFSLENASLYPVQAPDIQLILTNEQGLVLNKKSFLPKEYGSKIDILGPRSQSTFVLPLTDLSEITAASAKGYQVKIEYQEKNKYYFL